VTIHKFKLDYDVIKLRAELDELWPLENYHYHDGYPTPHGSYAHNILTNQMPSHIKTAIENSIGRNIKDYYFLWDFRCQTTELLHHRDVLPTTDDELNTGNLTDARAEFNECRTANTVNDTPLSVVVSLENDFRLDVLDDDTGEWESMEYGPGDIVYFNNISSMHGGSVLRDLDTVPRRTLNCYIDAAPFTKDES